MKSFLPPILLLCAILTFSLWNCAGIARDTHRWSEPLEEAAQLAEAEDWQAAVKRLSGSYADWSAHQTYLHIVAEHAAVDGAEAMYRRAFAYAAARESSEFQADLADLCNQLRLLSEMEEVNIKNVL